MASSNSVSDGFKIIWGYFVSGIIWGFGVYLFLVWGCFFGFVFFPQTVCPHYGVLTVGVRSGVLRGVLPQPRFSTAQARTEFRL